MLLRVCIAACLLFPCLISGGIVFAQKITFEAGLITGVHGADIRGGKEEFWGDDYERSGFLGYSAGSFVRISFNPALYSVIELRYMRKGSNFGYINQFFTQSFECIRFNCIEIPLLFGSKGVFHAKSGNINFCFEGGISYSKIFSSSLKFDELTQRQNKVNSAGFREHELSWVAMMHVPYNTGERYTILLGFHIERSLFSIHNQFKLYNFDYGIELTYLFMNL